MINDAPPEIQKVIDRGMAEEIAAYVTRRNDRARTKEATLADVCKRFSINQKTALRIIEGNPDKLMLSEFAYRSASREAEQRQNWGEMLFAAFYPQHWPDAPLGRRLVCVARQGESND